MTYEQIKDKYKGVSGSIDYYDYSHRFFYIDVDQDKLEGVESYTLSCGCCGDYRDVVTEISYEVQYMDESDLKDFIEQLDKLKAIS